MRFKCVGNYFHYVVGLYFEKWKIFLFRINFVGKNIIPSPNLLNLKGKSYFWPLLNPINAAKIQPHPVQTLSKPGRFCHLVTMLLNYTRRTLPSLVGSSVKIFNLMCHVISFGLPTSCLCNLGKIMWYFCDLVYSSVEWEEGPVSYSFHEVHMRFIYEKCRAECLA